MNSGDAGIFYTPRTEIDLMCRLALVDNLANHLGEEHKSALYKAVFAFEPDERTADADQTTPRKETSGISLDERLERTRRRRSSLWFRFILWSGCCISLTICRIEQIAYLGHERIEFRSQESHHREVISTAWM